MAISSLVAKQVDLCVEAVGSSWAADHRAAMHCLDIEDRIAMFILAYDMLVHCEENWRVEAYRDESCYDEFNDQFNSIFARWLDAAKALDARTQSVESQGFDVSGAAKFRQRLRECQYAQTPDSDFFADDELANLRDKALDAHAKGETIEFRPS